MSKKINDHDVFFILNKTKLKIKDLLSLIEEERDFNLVLNAIGSNLSLDDIKLFNILSESLRAKLSIYYCSKDKDYDINDKSYICGLMAKNYKYVYKTCYKLKTGQSDEAVALLSVINDTDIGNDKIKVISNKMRLAGQVSISRNLTDWISIINKSKKLISCVNSSE